MHQDRHQKLISLRQQMRELERANGHREVVKSRDETDFFGFSPANDEVASKKPHLHAPIDAGKHAALFCHSPQLDAQLTSKMLSQHVLHEVMPKTYADPASISFLMLALKQQSKQTSKTNPILWANTTYRTHEVGHLFAPGLFTFGLDPSRFVMVRAKNDTELLWILEEATRSKSFTAVVGDVQDINFTQTRRLSLATQAGETPLFLHRPHHCHGASAAFCRWQIESQSSTQNTFDNKAPGIKQVRAHLLRSRSGQTGSWSIHYETTTYPVFMVSAAANRTFTSQVATEPSRWAKAGE